MSHAHDTGPTLWSTLRAADAHCFAPTEPIPQYVLDMYRALHVLKDGIVDALELDGEDRESALLALIEEPL